MKLLPLSRTALQSRRVISAILLASLPTSLLWPYWRHALPQRLADHLMSAIYEFPSDDLPRCEQFVHHTDAAELSRPVACQTSPGQLMV